MNNLLTYRNIGAQASLKPGALKSLLPALAAAALAAAAERIWAKQVTDDGPVTATNGKPIPAGHYAIVEVDEDGLTIIAAEPTFFQSVWELDVPGSEPV